MIGFTEGESNDRTLEVISGQKTKCDIDDIMCQFQMLSYLEGMKNLLGSERFQERYPEFKGLDDVVKEKISEQSTITKEMMERCGMPTEEFEKEEGMTEHGQSQV